MSNRDRKTRNAEPPTSNIEVKRRSLVTRCAENGYASELSLRCSTFAVGRLPDGRPIMIGCNPRVVHYISRSFMAKTAWINRNERKRNTVKKYAALRAELKAKKDYAGLTQLPRDASPTRVVNRCQVSGRRRAFIRRFKISRLTFRELASQGLIPGVTKSSW